MEQITALENGRIKHVNSITIELHDSCDERYESLRDDDDAEWKEITKTLLLQLKAMIDSMHDDLQKSS